MGDMLSQEEIDALLHGVSSEDESMTEDVANLAEPETEALTPEEVDALGEIGNISMGTSATTLYALLGQKVTITTPRVEVTTWDKIAKLFVKPFVAVKVQYTEGLKGLNLLIVKEEDVKIITDLMMGGDGFGNINGELNELHLSAISEAMNQMVGSASTSLSSMFDKRVDISPPESTLVDSAGNIDRIKIGAESSIVMIMFKLQVGELIDSEIMQFLPIPFAKEMVKNLMNKNKLSHSVNDNGMAQQPPVQNQAPQMQQAPLQQPQAPQMPPQYAYQPEPQAPGFGMQMPRRPQPSPQPINVQPAQFQSFEEDAFAFDGNNIGLLMDVPLQISVELGRTTKKIREILEFGQGSIIELDKLAGDPVDILVNGKVIAKGEVVVIDESFGVRITDILHPSKRL
ncbi:MAG TPA: flagellar motor switch phosphatase FliY [Thermoclostridium caenicola]|uniref:flagellar motor switch phosphatase FliY n=1 Tax=Thermoclostridium caenicola TaxID=659425 RepID=UPI002BA175F4|nr:flagellar motor switch phosphatase FliY [Thermoclostridium caenicola]HOK42054.1 flagellar motor switch phosphatase FliY [Thermoclostridium caenicola]HOL84697.1 flagellar motor switch phosphatase FliY [Thermoclostridium caenicola]HPO75845.1 flagellar motor switch phosphatase FliY [Thermoclostridium caenicola]